MRTVDLLIENAAQVATCASPGGPKRGAALADAGLIPDGAVAVDKGIIVDVGPSTQVAGRVRARRTIDASGRCLCPGLVDCHTHALYAGSRVDEWERKLRGEPYLDILAAGGGILSTVRATRAASAEALAADGARRLLRMAAQGATTVEIKSGYGLDLATELRLLEAMALLAQQLPLRIVPTLLAAHAVPPESAGNGDHWISQIVEELLPRAAEWYAGSPFGPAGATPAPFFQDIFVEQHAFGVEQARRLLQAGAKLELAPKLHVDQFHALGGATLAAELGAASADHLDATPDAEIAALAASSTVAVLLPATLFHTGATTYPRARAFIDAGAAVALATDLNPGSAPCDSLPFVMGLACRYMGLSPAEALNACTINAAHALQMGHRIGSIEPGKSADLLLLDSDDFRTLPYWMGAAHVQALFIGGVQLLPGAISPFAVDTREAQP
jgi:imidazolonepropionase